VLFDHSFDLDDSALYCLEMTANAFRSQGLALTESVRLEEMENATQYPISVALFVSISPLVLKKLLTREQRVYMPGNARHGMGASPLLEVVYPPASDRSIEDMPRRDGRFSLGGNLAIIAGIVNELRTSDGLRSEREARSGLGRVNEFAAAIPPLQPRDLGAQRPKAASRPTAGIAGCPGPGTRAQHEGPPHRFRSARSGSGGPGPPERTAHGSGPTL
jgi:hypothetical protein